MKLASRHLKVDFDKCMDAWTTGSEKEGVEVFLSYVNPLGTRQVDFYWIPFRRLIKQIKQYGVREQ